MASRVQNPNQPQDSVIDPQQIIKERNAAIETEKKAKQYWDDYYDCTETYCWKI
jgi:hypothetical protein